MSHEGVEQPRRLLDAPLLAQVRAVVRGEDDGRVFPQPEIIELLKQASDPAVHKGHFARIEGADPRQVLPADVLAANTVAEERTVEGEVVVVLLREAQRGIPRLVGIEHLDPEQERLVGGVVLQPRHGPTARLRAEVVVLRLPMARVHKVLARQEVILLTAHVFGHVPCGIDGSAGPGLPPVGFLPADPFPGIERPVEVEVRLEKVRAVHDEPGPDALRVGDLGDRDVAGIERLPPALRQDRVAGEKDAPHRDGGEAVPVALGEGYALGREPVEIGRLDPVVAVTPQVIGTEGVADHHDDIHGPVLLLGDGPGLSGNPARLRRPARGSNLGDGHAPGGGVP